MLNRIRPELRIFIFSCATYIVAGFMSTLTSTLMAYFAADTGMTSGMQGIFLSMGGLMTAIVASLPGRVVDRFGTKKTLYLIAVGLLASLLLFSTAHSGIECMIWFSLYSLVTAASVPCSTQALKVYRVEDPSKLLRINLIGNMVAGMVAASFSAALIETMGLTWRQAFLVFAGISAVILLIGFLFMFSLSYDFSGVASATAASAEARHAEKSYRYTDMERNACIALCLLYIGYMGVGIALGNWMPAYLQGKGFTGVEVSLPNTVGKFVQLAAYILLPTVAAKLPRSIKVTPVACALLIVSIFGILVSTNLTVITVARGLLAAIMGFLSMHVQSDCALVSPKKAGGRFSSTVLASANAGGVVAVILMGYLPGVMSKLIMLIIFACLGILGAVLLIRPYQEISKLKANAGD